MERRTSPIWTIVLGAMLVSFQAVIAAPAPDQSKTENKEASAIQRQVEVLQKQKQLLEVQNQVNKLRKELSLEEADFRISPTFAKLLGALSGFIALILLLSIVPEKLTDFFKTTLRVDKKDTLAELFGWTSYSSVIGETDKLKLEAVYRTLYGVVGENMSLAWTINRKWRERTVKKFCEGLIEPHEIGATQTQQNPGGQGSKPNDTEDELVKLRRNIIALDLRMIDLEGRRVIWLRFWTGVFGIIMAAALGINVFVLLSPIMPSGLSASLDETLFRFPLLAHGWPVTAGILLTGLGAGMGSSFWHDFLDRLTSAKLK